MGDLVSRTSPDQKDPTPASHRDGEETVYDKRLWSLAGKEETRETEKSFIAPELAEIHLPAQGGEDTSSWRLQMAVQGGEGVEKNTKLNESPNLEIQSLRSGIGELQDKRARERQESAASRDRDSQRVFRDPARWMENRQRKAALDSSRKERRLLKGRILGGQKELGKERRVLGEEDLRTELRQVIRTLQITDHKMEDLPEENRGRMEELPDAEGAEQADADAV